MKKTITRLASLAAVLTAGALFTSPNAQAENLSATKGPAMKSSPFANVWSAGMSQTPAVEKNVFATPVEYKLSAGSFDAVKGTALMDPTWSSRSSESSEPSITDKAVSLSNNGAGMWHSESTTAMKALASAAPGNDHVSANSMGGTNAAPEPTTWAMLLLGAAALVVAQRKRVRA